MSGQGAWSRPTTFREVNGVVVVAELTAEELTVRQRRYLIADLRMAMEQLTAMQEACLHTVFQISLGVRMCELCGVELGPEPFGSPA